MLTQFSIIPYALIDTPSFIVLPYSFDHSLLICADKKSLNVTPQSKLNVNECLRVLQYTKHPADDAPEGYWEGDIDCLKLFEDAWVLKCLIKSALFYDNLG